MREHSGNDHIQVSYLLPDSATTDSIMVKAKTLAKNEQFDSAKILYEYIASASAPFDKRLSVTYCYLALGDLHFMACYYDSALYHYKFYLSSVAHSKEAEAISRSAYAYAILGSIYSKRKNFDSATVCLYRGIALLNNLDKVDTTTERYVYTTYETIGIYLFNMEKPEMARPYLLKAEEIAERKRDSVLLSRITNWKAGVYFKDGRLDSAIWLYTAVLENNKAKPEAKLNAYYNLGVIYAMPEFKKEPKKAIPYFEKGLALSKENRELQGQQDRFKFVLGTAYLNIALRDKDKYYFKKADLIFQTVDTIQLLDGNLKNFYYNYATLYYNTGQYKKAAEHSNRAVRISDSLHRLERQANINESEMQYRTLQKDKLLAQNKLQIARQKNKIQGQYLLIGGTISGVLIVILLLILMLRRKQHRSAIAKLKDVMAGEEKERIRLARELHDGIVSQLSAIKMQFSTLPALHPDMNEASEDFQSALQHLEQSIAELRTTSHNMLPEILERTDLGEATEIYCQKISQLTPCAIDFVQVGNLPVLTQDFQLTVYRILQELVQNVIKHSGATNALVQFNAHPVTLYITVDDNGSGISIERELGVSGMGLHNLRQRLATVGGKMEKESQPGNGTSVYLSFDLKGYTRKRHENQTDHRG